MTSRRSHPLSEEAFHAITRALADPRRFAIFEQIAAAPECLPCSALRELNPISPATMSHHIRELTGAGLIDVAREGRTMQLTLSRPLWQAYLKRLAKL